MNFKSLLGNTILFLIPTITFAVIIGSFFSGPSSDCVPAQKLAHEMSTGFSVMYSK